MDFYRIFLNELLITLQHSYLYPFLRIYIYYVCLNVYGFCSRNKLIRIRRSHSRYLADVPQNAIQEHVRATLERLYRLCDAIADRLVPQSLIDSNVVRQAAANEA